MMLFACHDYLYLHTAYKYKDAICTFSAFLLGLVLKVLDKMDFSHFFSVLQHSSNCYLKKKKKLTTKINL